MLITAKPWSLSQSPEGGGWAISTGYSIFLGLSNIFMRNHVTKHRFSPVSVFYGILSRKPGRVEGNEFSSPIYSYLRDSVRHEYIFHFLNLVKLLSPFLSFRMQMCWISLLDILKLSHFFFFLQKYVAVSNRSLMKATDLKTLMEL